MIKFKKRKGRGYNSFGRGTKKFKNFEGNHLPNSRKVGWSHITYTSGKMFRYLISNVGRPIDKVFSEFLERCESSMFNAKDYFFSYIEKKEEVSSYWGGFYVTNGILNYKKRRRQKKTYQPLTSDYNKEKFKEVEKKLTRLCEESRNKDRIIYMGEFYVYGYRHKTALRSVFIRRCSSLNGFLSFNRVNIIGVGSYVVLEEITSETGNKKLNSRVTDKEPYWSDRPTTYEFISKTEKSLNNK